MGAVRSATELAVRLVGSGKPITSVRLQKLVRHLIDRDHLVDVLCCLEADAAEHAWQSIQPFLGSLS